MNNKNIYHYFIWINVKILFVDISLTQIEIEPIAYEKQDKVHYIQFSSEVPEIDGVLNEKLWKELNPIIDFDFLWPASLIVLLYSSLNIFSFNIISVLILLVKIY